MDNELVFQILSEKEIALQTKIMDALAKNMPGLAEKTITRIKGVEEETKLKIAFVGQHNSGKSTIVSALTRNKDIKISSNVETDDTSSYEWNDVLLYDTPGLYAGVKDSHDASALEAIKNSDVLVFCITSSLFDDLLIENFVDLAYKRAYKNKIILVVNKMSQEDAPYEELKKNYLSTLNSTLEELGGNLADFPMSFIDAKDYKDGLDDEDDELIEISHFNSFVNLLNDQITSRGLLAKIGTKCNILLDALGEAIASTGTELDKNMMIILNRASRTIRNYRKEMKYELERIEMDLRGAILDIGGRLTDKIGVSEITENDLNETNREIEKKTSDHIEVIEKNLTTKLSEMFEEIEDVLASEIGLYVFEEINSEAFKADSACAKDYSEFLEKYGSAAKMIRHGGDTVAKMALSKGATDFSTLASSSGSAIHKAIVDIGHFFGVKFKPWQAVKIAHKIGKIAKVVGPLLSVVDVAVTIASKVGEDKRRKEIQNARESAFNSISGVASDIITQIDKQYALMEAEAFDKKLDEINTIKDKMVKEAGENSDFIDLLRGYGDGISGLLSCISETNAY